MATEDFAQMITLAELKPRVSSQQFSEFREKFQFIFSTDVNSDLNLPVRENNSDVARDLLRVSFRYLHQSSPVLMDLQTAFEDVARCKLSLVPLDLLQAQAKRLEDWLVPVIHEANLAACKQLVTDLREAMAHLDDVQDLRTSLCFLYLAHDKVQRELPSSPAWVASQRHALLRTYCAIVLMDDASAPMMRASFSRIPVSTRQYLQRARAGPG
ncbi:unnamed protein product [Effrenium voratum]|uniref:Uncharacterized protein n=1 Tax=Effrenium voratum TaxID=2562239 RepID=A0AA36MMY4_9DINO|nr:unnamed protein product [Effrenium voratum]CAJ1421649.1 unnamed protein product [Effrenium voratum]